MVLLLSSCKVLDRSNYEYFGSTRPFYKELRLLTSAKGRHEHTFRRIKARRIIKMGFFKDVQLRL
jgi:hypothetical protein